MASEYAPNDKKKPIKCVVYWAKKKILTILNCGSPYLKFRYMTRSPAMMNQSNVMPPQTPKGINVDSGPL